MEEPTSRRRRDRDRIGAWDLGLTDRELDVLRHIAAGGTNKDVAAALGITPKTVMHHSVAIYRKLGVRGRAEATAYAYRSNLIDAPPTHVVRGDARSPSRASARCAHGRGRSSCGAWTVRQPHHAIAFRPHGSNATPTWSTRSRTRTSGRARSM